MIIIALQTILFDMDGVLVDESSSYRQAIQATYKFFTKQEVTTKEIQKLKDEGGYNNDWDATAQLVKRAGIIVKKNEIVDKFQEYYLGVNGTNGFRNNETWLLSKNILEELATKYNLGIVTGRPRIEALYVLEKEKVMDYFGVLVGMEDMGSMQKPSPFGIILALKTLGGGEAIYLGDSVDDMKAANKAGLKGIGVIPPQGNVEQGEILKQNGAALIINKIDEILKVIE